jgi:hypothetical protein
MPGSPSTVTVARARSRSSFFNLRRKVVVLSISKGLCPESSTGRPWRVTIGLARQSLGTSTVHVKVVVSETIGSMDDGLAVRRPLMSAHSGSGPGPPSGGAAQEELPQTSIAASAIGAMRVARISRSAPHRVAFDDRALSVT